MIKRDQQVSVVWCCQWVGRIFTTTSEAYLNKEPEDCGFLVYVHVFEDVQKGRRKPLLDIYTLNTFSVGRLALALELLYVIIALRLLRFQVLILFLSLLHPGPLLRLGHLPLEPVLRNISQIKGRILLGGTSLQVLGVVAAQADAVLCISTTFFILAGG